MLSKVKNISQFFVLSKERQHIFKRPYLKKNCVSDFIFIFINIANLLDIRRKKFFEFCKSLERMFLN